MAGVAAELLALVDRTIEGLGLELVDLERAGGGLLRVTIDAPDAGNGVTIEHCQRVSHQLTHLLAVADVDYARLEVGSPGVDRPLKKARDFVRFAGLPIKVQLFAPVNGRKRMHAVVRAVSGEPGAERLQLEVLPDGPEQPAGGRAGKPVRGPKAVAPAKPVDLVEVALADIDKARLVPVLDFRSGRK